MLTCMKASLQKADGGNEMDGRDNRRMILHIMAGGYLMYLAYGIGKGNLSGETPENRLLLMWICAAVFGAVGADPSDPCTVCMGAGFQEDFRNGG